MTKRFLSLLMMTMLLLTLFAPAAGAEDWIMYVYTENGKSLNVRSDPMVANNVIGGIPYGEAVSVRMTLASGWACIDWAAGDGYVAYVQSRYLLNYKPGAAPSGGSSGKSSTPASVTTIDTLNAEFRTAKKVNAYTVYARPARATGWVNLRWAPSTDAERIATCPQGKELTVIAETKNWFQVQDPTTGMIGFISRQYVSVR